MAEGIVREDLNVTGVDFKDGNPVVTTVKTDTNSNPVNWVPTPTHFGNQIPAKSFLDNSAVVNWPISPTWFGNKFGTAGPPVLPPDPDPGPPQDGALLQEDGVFDFLLEDSSGVILLEGGVVPPPPPPTVNILQVQTTQATPGHSASSLVFTGVTNVAGNMILVAVYWADITSTITSVTDSRGNTYTLAAGVTRNSQISSSLYYAKNIAAGANVVTVAFNTTAVRPSAMMSEYSGLSTTAPLDAVSIGTGNGSVVDSGAITPANDYELLIGSGCSGPNKVFTAAGAGWSTALISADADMLEQRVVNAAGAYNATATMTSGLWIMQMAAFQQ